MDVVFEFDLIGVEMCFGLGEGRGDLGLREDELI